MGNLNNLFNPKNIALIGASDRGGSVGRIALTNLLQAKDRKIFPVNPNRKSVLGLECFRDVASISGRVDCAVIATPAREVPGLVEACGKAGIGGAVIFSAGFKETGEEGRLLEEQVAALRKQYGMRILGPNCLGFVRPNAGLNATFMRTSPPSGHIAFISQSGALGSAILDWAVDEHVGFSMFASIGAMMDVDFGDLIDFLGDDSDTRSILIYMEGVGNAKKFMSAARAFSMRKPIIIIKPGRFTESAKAARSHTGSMAGDDVIYEAAFERVGVVRVKEIADLFNVAAILDSRKLPRGPKLAIVTAAGGPGVMATDALLDNGGKLARLSNTTIERLDQELPPFWSKGNPVDVLGDADPGRYGKAMKICLEDSEVDGVLVIYVPTDLAPSDKVAQAVIESAKNTGKPVIASWIGGQKIRAALKTFAENSVPGYETPEEAVKAYVNMHWYQRNLELLYETPAELPVRETLQMDITDFFKKMMRENKHLKDIIKKAIEEGRTILNEDESKAFLAAYWIPTTIPSITHDTEGALIAARKIGYPVVIKIVSPDITHKTDVGGVTVGINSDEQLRQAYEHMMTTVRARAPEAVIEGIAVQKMVEDIDYEVILGSKKDKDFGSVILFGMGGITAELIKDFSIGFPPLNRSLARRLMEETRAYKLIKGWRGKTPANLDELETILVLFSYLITGFPEIAEIDINPLAISLGKACAIDARIILDKDCLEPVQPYPHLVIAPYPIRFVTTSELPDGTRVVIRPIMPEDEPLEREFLATLSDESRRTRFFSSFRNISHDWLVMFCNIDYDRHIAMVAEINEDGQRKIIGVVRLILDPDFDSGEIAALVHDRFQRRGLGQKLMEVVARIAKWKGLKEIHGQVLMDNEKMLGLCKKLGYTTNMLPGGITRITLQLKQDGRA
ncbi:MAG: bifunctional acetate--CoA ligase family protein/GNAT family N-acetyltransferase [Syntrophorhabdaceae bacterium]|nr:bifunctional acetate--CoA ligase family protein/GNAT family N-acetyltransferase [Syntrophorhabdaceae bacterium]MDD4195333.1 bifunctional acetate--CoA ligase family protein/GNAT family N-acetyltransferase [Syntrophorhabdaceae bacterium]